ncbi:hypothetical protein [Empedobacter falsenii]
MKKSVFLFTTLFSVLSFGQVGINTENPQGIFNVDGKSSPETTNPKTGIPDPLQASDDFVITSSGSVGIGTISPDPSAILDVNTDGASNGNKRGFLGPKVSLESNTDQTTIANPAIGLLVYNLGKRGLTTEGYLYWNGTEWVKFSTRSSISPSINKLDCNLAYITPKKFEQGVPYIGTLVIPYAGGNGGSYPAGSPILSTGITGLTATLQYGDLEYGVGQLIYSITGTPSGSSPNTAEFAIDFFGQSCSATVGKNELSRGESEYFSGTGVLASLSNVLLSSNGDKMPTIEDTFQFDAFAISSSNSAGPVSIVPRVYNISNEAQKFWWMGMTSQEGRGDANVILAPNGYQNLDNGMYLGYGVNMVKGVSTPGTAVTYSNNTEGYNFDFILEGNKWYKVEMSFTIDNMDTTNNADNVRKWYCRITRMF